MLEDNVRNMYFQLKTWYGMIQQDTIYIQCHCLVRMKEEVYS